MATELLPPTANAEYLTTALRKAGVLGDGRVRDIVVERSFDTLLSHIFRLQLGYEGTSGPEFLILKAGLADRPGGPWKAGRHEVAFYTQVASAILDHLVPRCFDARWDADTGAWHLLMEDLTDSHSIASRWPLPPTLEQCERIVQVRARFHAAWWDDPRLGVTIGSWQDDAAIDRQLQEFNKNLAGFTERSGDCLSPHRRDLYARLVDCAPRLQMRYRSHRNMTIVQGDSHVWNCFLARDGAKDDGLLFDWDSWRIDTASDDLSYMMAIHWYPDRRRQIERPLLDSYHAALEACGVKGYTRRDLDDDYRLSVLWHTTTPVWQEANGTPPVIWWNNLERIFMAVDDLGCRELLE
jgi:hypothetical protein